MIRGAKIRQFFAQQQQQQNKNKSNSQQLDMDHQCTAFWHGALILVISDARRWDLVCMASATISCKKENFFKVERQSWPDNSKVLRMSGAQFPAATRALGRAVTITRNRPVGESASFTTSYSRSSVLSACNWSWSLHLQNPLVCLPWLRERESIIFFLKVFKEIFFLKVSTKPSTAAEEKRNQARG